MAKQDLNLGTVANDHTGDSIRVAGGKINNNFAELYAALGNGSILTVSNVAKTGSYNDLLDKPAFNGFNIVSVPTSLTSPGSPRDVAIGAIDNINYLFVCTSTDTWKIIPLRDDPLVQVSAPNNLYGKLGDRAGLVAYDANNFYYCIADYVDNSTNIWKTIPWGGGGSSFDQDLNTTDSVKFNSLSLGATQTIDPALGVVVDPNYALGIGLSINSGYDENNDVSGNLEIFVPEANERGSIILDAADIIINADLTTSSNFYIGSNSINNDEDGNLQITSNARLNLSSSTVVNIEVDSGEKSWQFDDSGAIVSSNGISITTTGMTGPSFGINVPDSITGNDALFLFDTEMHGHPAIVFPDGSSQFYAWGGGVVRDVPASSIGSAGEKQGDIAFDNTYFYYCSADVPTAESTMMTVLASSGIGAYVDRADYDGDLVADFTANPTGWTFNGQEITDISTSVVGGTTYQLLSSTNWSVGNGIDYELVSPEPDPVDVWKRIAWSNDTW